MLRLFILFRWLIFALLVACNAIVCSLAAWNLGLVQELFLSVSPDAFVIAISALELAFIFPIIFVDIGRRNALTSRVWFEMSWVFVFFVLELTGSALITSKAPGVDRKCLFSSEAPCDSTTALLVMSWLSTILLLLYFVVLVTSAYLHQKDYKHVWQTGVRDFPWYDAQRWQKARSVPPSPVLPTFNKSIPAFAAPKPRRTVPPPILVQQSELRSNYEIEHYISPNRPKAMPAQPPPPAASNAALFYPPYLQSTLSTLSSARSSRSLGKQKAVERPDEADLEDIPRTGSPEMFEISLGPRARPPSLDSQRPSPPRNRPSGPRTRTSLTGPRPPPTRPSLDGSFQARDPPPR